MKATSFLSGLCIGMAACSCAAWRCGVSIKFQSPIIFETIPCEAPREAPEAPVAAPPAEPAPKPVAPKKADC